MMTTLFVLSILGVATPAWSFELSGGVDLGGLLAGAVPHLAVSPYAAISWPMSSGFMVAAHELVSILPPTHHDGPGVYEQTSLVLGYAGERRNFSMGPSLSAYTMPACGPKLCGRVVGVAPGGHAQVNVYFYGPLGVSVNASLDWVGGRSLALGGLAAMVVAGPVFRWTQEQNP